MKPILLSMSNFLFYILLLFLSDIGIVYLLSLLLVSDYTSFYGGRENTVAAKQLQMALMIFCAVSIYPTTARYSGTYTLPTSILLY